MQTCIASRAKILPLDTAVLSQLGVKVLRGISRSDFIFQQLIALVSKVAGTWYRLSHANIVQFLGLSYDVPHHIGLVVPYYENANVIEYLAAHSNGERELVHLTLGAAAGLAYLHEHGVVHTDLRGCNVLVDGDGNARLTDIGLSPVFSGNNFTTANPALASRWQAPEVLQFEGPEDVSAYTLASDVYAFGMLLVEMITLKPPFSHRKQDTVVIFDVIKGQRPHKPPELDQVRDAFWQLAEECWKEEPAARPSSSAVFDWLQRIVPS
ncbi:kinase-like protein [Heliocybe sulcata]|uniref:Kinase-like protein n=1 Tax=Heliocybe sulcata TaxID=5364 RepID=A0A5C3N2G2_9AGAM|nr:kinase-like protein [Heliocybe sulcata]